MNLHDFIITETSGNNVTLSQDATPTSSLFSGPGWFQSKRKSLCFTNSLQNAQTLLSLNLFKAVKSATSVNSVLNDLSTTYKIEVKRWHKYITHVHAFIYCCSCTEFIDGIPKELKFKKPPFLIRKTESFIAFWVWFFFWGGVFWMMCMWYIKMYYSLPWSYFVVRKRWMFLSLLTTCTLKQYAVLKTCL